MATQQILQVHGTQLLFADVTDFPNSGAGPPATAANDIRIASPTPTKVQIDLTGVAATEARQSDKTADLGSAFPEKLVLGACIEFEAAPDAGGTVDVYWAPSPSSVAATGNPGAVVGADGVFTVGTEDQLIQIGSMVLQNNVINIDVEIGTLRLPHRYGTLIVINNGSTAFRSTPTAMDETHITLTPVIPDLQAAV